MKHFSTPLIAICMAAAGLLPNVCSAQSSSPVSLAVGNAYAFTVKALVTPFNFVNNKPSDDSPAKVAQVNYQFTIIGEYKDSYIITFTEWNSAPELNEQFVEKKAVSSAAEEKGQLFFTVLKDKLEAKVYRVYYRGRRPEVSTGAVIIPVKMRFSKFDFTRDFSLGFSMGPRWRISKRRDHFVHLLGAFNVNIVNLDSANTGGHIRRATDKGALGLGLGGVLDFNGAQVGVFTGLDWLGRRERNNWEYQGKPWLSVGLGFTVFSRSTSVAATPVGKQ